MKASQLKTSFGKVAKEYQKYRRSYDKRLYSLLFSLIDKKSPAILKIADIGCGTGKSTEPIFTQVGKNDSISVFGIDPDPMMLREARLSAKKNNLPIIYIEGTAEKLPFSEGELDAVISGSAFHWFGNKHTLVKIKKVLKKNGVFCVFWFQNAKSDKPAIGASIYGRYHWEGIKSKFRGQPFVKNLFKKSGFKNVAIQTIYFSDKRSLSDNIGLIKTNSSYVLMSSKDKKDFSRDMTKAYRTALGGEKTTTENMELRICYGFK